MSIISITFHCPFPQLETWEDYVNSELSLLAENLMDVDHYILSEVETNYIEEGKNYNLLLMFSNDELREEFMESEIKNIEERIESKFGKEIMIFPTFLNPKKIRLS